MLRYVDHKEARSLIAATTGRAVVAFCRTECGPCDLLLGALKTLVEDEPAFEILITVVEAGVRGVMAANLALGVKAYPTIAFLEGGAILALHQGVFLVQDRVEVEYIREFLAGAG